MALTFRRYDTENKQTRLSYPIYFSKRRKPQANNLSQMRKPTVKKSHTIRDRFNSPKLIRNPSPKMSSEKIKEIEAKGGSNPARLSDYPSTRDPPHVTRCPKFPFVRRPSKLLFRRSMKERSQREVRNRQLILQTSPVRQDLASNHPCSKN